MAQDHRLGSVARRLAATQRVMVVEDEQDIADFLRAYFRASGYDLVHIDPDSPAAVIEAVDASEPDCLLLDLNLRGFSGTEVYRLLRTDARYALLPVIIVSARPDVHDLLPGSRGIDAFVSKPFNVNTLAELVMDRIASAARVRAAAATDDVTGLLGHEYVEARLIDELTVAAPDSAATFALVRLRSLQEITVTVGAEGSDYVSREVVAHLRDALPPEIALGLTRTDEVAILIPGTKAHEAVRLLQGAIDSIGPLFELPGGAEVPVRFAVGVASYPEHANDADSLYMAADVALAESVASDATITVSI